MLKAMRSALGENDMMAYLAMMAVRLIELHRVLKPTGSLYLHCDPTASHYLKMLLDAIFGRELPNEIIWKRTSAKGSRLKRIWASTRHHIYYSKKSDNWNQSFTLAQIENISGFIARRRPGWRRSRSTTLEIRQSAQTTLQRKLECTAAYGDIERLENGQGKSDGLVSTKPEGGAPR